jgi:hypothetical protein
LGTQLRWAGAKVGAEEATQAPAILAALRPWGAKRQVACLEAGDGARTHDPQLGKLILYQLSCACVVAILALDEARGRRRSVAPRLGIVGGRSAQGKRNT